MWGVSSVVSEDEGEQCLSVRVSDACGDALVEVCFQERCSKRCSKGCIGSYGNARRRAMKNNPMSSEENLSAEDIAALDDFYGKG